MARPRSRVLHTRPAARTMVWLDVQLLDTVVAAATNTLLLSLTAAELLLRPFTIVRTRFLIKYSSDQLAVSETAQGALGMMVVSDQASAAGAASIPGPRTNADAPWFVYEGLVDPFLFASGVGFTGGGSGGYMTKVDSKSMRKVGNNEDVVVMLEQRATFGGQVAIEGRLLVKLH